MDFTTITTSNNNNNTDDTNNSQLLHEQQQQQQQQIISTSLAAVSSPLIHTQQSQYQQQQAIRIETTNINNNNNNLSRTATPTVNNNNNESSLSISSSSIPRNPLSNKSKNKNDLNNNNNSNNNITTTQHHSSDSTLPIIDPILQPIINIKERLLSLRGCSLSKMNVNTILSENDIKLLCTTVRPILLDNNTNNILLELEAPIKVCGDIHGQYIDLLRIFDYGGFPPESNYLFLGDYVDRGKYSIEVICLLLCYKILYNNKFYILRGNHESSGINRIYGFYDECKRKYNIKIWKIFCDIFNCLPVSAIIDEKILCMHGGLSPELYNIEQILYIERPCDIPDIGLLCDLLWSDPSNNINGWESNDRGVSYIFGKDIVYNFCNDNNIDLIIRAHQVVEDGYEFFASKKLITIFSAPNYCGEFNNAGCILNIDENLLCTFQIIKPNLNKYNNNNNSNTKRKSNNNNSNNNNNNTDNNSNSNKSLLDNNDNDFDDLPNTNQIHTFLNANNNINNDIDNKNNNNEVTYNAHNNNHNDKYSNNS